MLGSPATCNSYILGYYSIPEVYASTTVFEDSKGNGYYQIELGIKNKKIIPLSCVFKNFVSDNGMYEEYCRQHNDTTYHTRLVHSLNDSPLYTCSYPASNFTSISITCDGEWDTTHPAGNSLGDITTFVGISIEPFISKGYVKYNYELEDQPELFNAVYPLGKGYGEKAYYPVSKLVDNLNKKDLALLGDGRTAFGDFPQICTLFIPKRENGSPCTLRITMANTDGKTYTTDVEIQ